MVANIKNTKISINLCMFKAKKTFIYSDIKIDFLNTNTKNNKTWIIYILKLFSKKITD